VAAALVAFVALVLAALFTDRLVELPRGLRPLLPLAAVLVPGAVLATLLALFRAGDREGLAGELDSFYAPSRDALRSALNLLRRRSSQAHSVNPFMLAETVRQAEALSDAVRPAEVARWGLVPARFAVAAVLAAGFVALFFWPYMGMDILLQRLLDPLGNHPRPSLTRIAVAGPLTREVPSGDDVSVEVQLSGKVPEDPQAALHVVRDAREEVVPMAPRPGNRFETELKGVASSAGLYVTAGDGRSAMYRIRVVPRPTVANVRVRYDYPPYTHLPQAEGPLENRQVSAVVGTRVRLGFEASLPVRESDLTFGTTPGGRRLRIRWDKARMKGSVALRIERDDTFRIHLLSDEGTDNRHDPACRIRAIQDNPPTVALTDVPQSTSFFRDDILRLRYIGSDDFGIAEAFLRCRQEPKGDPPVREWSLDLPEANAKSAAGSIAVDLRELTDEFAAAAQVQLVMVDTNGEEGYTPPLRLQIVADSADVQLQGLLAFQEAYESQLNATARALRAKAGQLGILIESLDDNTALTAKRKEMLRSVDRQLGVSPPEPELYSLIRRGAGPVVFRSFPFTEYPYHALRNTETCVGSWAVLRGVRFSEPELQAIEASPSPRQRLAEIRRQLEDQGAQVDQLAAAFSDTLLETRLRVLFLLTEEYLASAAEGPSVAASMAELAEEKQRERMEGIFRQASQVAQRVEDPESRDALASLEKARQLPAAEGSAATRSALRKLYSHLLIGPELGGRLGKRVEAYRRSHGLADEVRKARSAGALDLLEEALALQLRLRRDNEVLNDAGLFLSARVYEAVLTGDGGRTDPALRAAEQLADWSQCCDVLNRALLLRHGIRRLSEDTALGCLRLDSPELRVRWQAVREILMSLVRDQNAGRFAELPGPVREELAKLEALRDALGPGSGKQVLTDPRFPSAREKVESVAAAVAAHLRPAVERDTALARAQAGELLRDLAANLRAESQRVRAEIEAINQEAGPGGPEPQGREAFRALIKDQNANRPTPGRERFSELHAERMACHAIALAKVLDVRQLSGGAVGADGEAATNILAEYLAHLEEETYDRILAVYKTGHGTPTIFAVAARQFYQGAAPMLAKLGEWAERLAAGRGAELLKAQEYADLLRAVHKDTRHRAAMESLASHREFLRVFDAAKTPQERGSALHAMLGRDSEAAAYWQLLRLAVGDVSERTQAVLRAVQAASAQGMAAEDRKEIEAGIQQVRWILPAPEAAPVEAKPLARLLDEFAKLADRIGAGRLSRSSDDERKSAAEDLAEWHGRLLAAMQGMDARVARPPIRYRPRARYQRRSRTDLEHRLGQILRNEERWARRVAEAGCDVLDSRARALAGTADRDEVCWLAAQEQICRRKSAAVVAQQSRALELESEAPDERFIKMPPYLYKELLRALNKPYPTQFKTPALEYMRGLMNDAR
jgi:hypothetical protein